MNNGLQVTQRLAWLSYVAAGFSILIAVVLLVNHFQVSSYDPLTSHALAEKKDMLRDEPSNEQLKEEIRSLDLRIRQRFFRHLGLNQTGALLLIGGLAAFVLAARRLAALRAAPPSPRRQTDAESVEIRQRMAGRRALAATAMVVAGVLLMPAFLGKTIVPDGEAGLAALLASETDIDPGAAAEEYLAQWPQFRGPTGDGVAVAKSIPTDWDGSTGAGIAWKSSVSLPGFGSPIVWGDRVFVTGGDATARAVFCFAASNGALLWRQRVPNMPAPPGAKLEVQEFTGTAASTPATDGLRVFAIFATGELVAFRFDGRLAWSRHLGVPENPYGFATSLVVHQQKLIVQYDQGQAEEGKSRLYALDTATGRVVWEQRRELPSSWTTPLVYVHKGQTQLAVLSQPLAMAYDPASGRELWRADCLGADLAPSPVFASGLLYVVHPNVSIIALRVDGANDVTRSHIAWQNEDGAPDITSPVTDGRHLFAVTTWGTLTCLDAASGEKLAEKDLEMEFNASPVLVGNRLILVATTGTMLVTSADPGLEVLAQAELGEKVHASPAIVNGRLYLRSLAHLYAIGNNTESSAASGHDF